MGPVEEEEGSFRRNKETFATQVISLNQAFMLGQVKFLMWLENLLDPLPTSTGNGKILNPKF